VGRGISYLVAAPLPRADTLALKASEIEELADIYFYRPLGMKVAIAGRSLRLTPNTLSILGGLAGAAGGALLYDARLAMAGFGLLVVYGILDSADGQLARITCQTSELGRVLDGVAGYATHLAVYAAIVASVLHRGGGLWIVGVAVLAALCNAAQALMYDHHRTVYARVVEHGQPPDAFDVTRLPRAARWLYAGYSAAAMRLLGLHQKVERLIAARAVDGVVREADRRRYRACFLQRVWGWNMLGDNGRRYAIGLLAWFGHVEWFCFFILVPMNLAFVVLWYWQRSADETFLEQSALDVPPSLTPSCV
jgi:phosphatidylglycerophosphate synthase